MGKKTDRMSMSEKQGYLNSQADKYGINDRDYYDDEGNDNDRSKRDDIIQAMNSDYDLRESMKYGRASGNKYFDKVGTNISNINDAVNAGTAVDKYGYKELGHKNMSSDNDYAAVSSSLFNASRDKFQGDMESNMEDKYATADKLNALQDKIKERTEQTGPVEISSTLTNAQRDIGNYDEDKTSQGANIFGAVGEGNDLDQATEEVMASDTSGDSVNYKTQYASNVKGGLQLSGTKTRGPHSGLMRDGSGFG